MKNQRLQSKYHAVSEEVGKFTLHDDFFRADIRESESGFDLI